MTQQEKTRLLNTHTVQYEKITELIELIGDQHQTDRMTLSYLQLIALQNQIIILNQTPVTNDIQNPLHY